jgi:hydroxymethylpyrimidine/phosphomethylpyrimidine kinase
VLVKGGHLEGSESSDLLASATGDREWLVGERIDSPNTHGTGCVLSAAIAARLAHGDPLDVAVRAGKAFVTEAIRHSLAIGKGIGPVNPLFQG